MAGSLFQRARFIAHLVLTVAKRALPPATQPVIDDEPLIEALQTGNLTALDAIGPSFAKSTNSHGTPWFFLALETGTLTTVDWFLTQGADPNQPDPSGRLPLETLIQRATIADDFDDHHPDCAAMVRALILAGANPNARTLQGATLFDLAQMAGLPLAQ